MPTQSEAFFTALEPRRLLAAQPLAINFNDEALWDNNFGTAVAQAKALGVKAVRVWLGFEGYNDRPNAFDPPSQFGSVFRNGEYAQNDAERVMDRVFDLKDQGFSVLVTVNDSSGSVPSSSASVRAFYRHLLAAPQYRGGARTLADVVDYWEIGNEPDNGFFWAPSKSGKTYGLQSYVDKLLVPAAEAIHSYGGKVVSGGISYSPTDLKTVLDRLSSTGHLASIDYAGFHPYGTHTAGGSSQIVNNTNAAVYYAKSVGKMLMATEWNVRGYGTSGANDAAWAKAMDDAYWRAIKPNYAMAYYFTLINNWSGRGGKTTARPGGLLKHTYVSASSALSKTSVSTLKAYYESPLVTSGPFYTTFKNWAASTQSSPITPAAGAISGTIFGPTTPITAAAHTVEWKVYLDANGNGKWDPTEKSTGVGNDLQYAFGGLAAGTYHVGVAAVSGWHVLRPSAGLYTVGLTAGQSASKKDFVVTT